MAPRKTRNVPSRVGEEEEDASDDAIVVVVNVVVVLAKDDDCKSGGNVASSFCLGFRQNPKLFPQIFKNRGRETTLPIRRKRNRKRERERERERKDTRGAFHIRSLSFFLLSRDGELCSDDDNEATETTAPVF